VSVVNGAASDARTRSPDRVGTPNLLQLSITSDRGDELLLASRRDRLGLLFGVGLFAAAVAGLSLVAVVWAPERLDTAVWWPAAGLSVAIVARYWSHRRLLIGVVIVASGFGNALGGRGVGLSCCFAVSNGLEAAVAGWMLTRRSGRPELRSLEDVWRLVAAAAAGAAVIASGAAAAVVVFGDGGFVSVWRLVAASHGAAVLVIAPLTMTVDAQTSRWSVERVGQWLIMLGVLFAVFAPGGSVPLPFMVLPAAMWGALRFGVRTATVQLFAIALVAVFFTSEGRGPFFAVAGVVRSPSTVGALTQVFVISSALMLLPLAVVVRQRAAALEEISSREDMFRQGFSQSLLGMMLLRQVGGTLRIAEFNDRSVAMLGMSAEQLIDSDWLEVIREGIVGDRPEPGKSWRGEVRLDVDNATRWLDVAVSPMRSSANTDMFTVQLVDVTRRRETEAFLSVRASSDSLTGLVNRSYFLERLTERLAASDRGSVVALLFLDLDDFKDVNDSAGHLIGDDVLVEVANRLATITRPGDVLARFGGDEFVVLCDALTCPEQAEGIATRLIEAVGHSVDVHGISYPVGLSIGIALGSQGTEIDELMSNADTAMYASKAAGKNRMTLFSETHRAHAIRTVGLQSELRRALELDEFVLYVQPIVDIATAEIVGGEALVRWQHPTRGLLYPHDWLDVAESTGMMPALGQWVLDTACRLAADWPPGGPGNIPRRIHVNVSARQLDSGNFGQMVERILHDAHLRPDHLAIEFTETHLARIRPELLDDLRALNATGVGLAADDFGTGYSPLTKITELPLDMVKIDKQFVAGMIDDPRSLAVVQALVGLGKALTLDVVAEGVETLEQAKALHQIGCPYGQGFLWSQAVPPTRFVELLATPGRIRQGRIDRDS
jgi:diguanylate cyclase (GGDEF)-like protein/PAS domain S-box-containing protein